MKTLRTLLVLAAIGAGLTNISGCATTAGAAVGGYAGHELGGGSRAATVGGAVAGGVIGHEIAK